VPSRRQDLDDHAAALGHTDGRAARLRLLAPELQRSLEALGDGVGRGGRQGQGRRLVGA
jgi:hypothetical protein